jgi:hypothetical protein
MTHTAQASNGDPSELVADCSRLAMMSAGAFWLAWLGLLWPHAAAHHLSTHGGGELIVPEPIEDDGEHALFA